MNKTKIMCPACNGAGIRKEVSLRGTIFKRKKVITFYCPLCHFENKKEFELSRDDYEAEILKKRKIQDG